MKPTEKKQLVAKLIEKYVANGYDVVSFVGKPLCYFDAEKIKTALENDDFFKC